MSGVTWISRVGWVSISLLVRVVTGVFENKLFWVRLFKWIFFYFCCAGTVAEAVLIWLDSTVLAKGNRAVVRVGLLRYDA